MMSRPISLCVYDFHLWLEGDCRCFETCSTIVKEGNDKRQTEDEGKVSHLFSHFSVSASLCLSVCLPLSVPIYLFTHPSICLCVPFSPAAVSSFTCTSESFIHQKSLEKENLMARLIKVDPLWLSQGTGCEVSSYLPWIYCLLSLYNIKFLLWKIGRIAFGWASNNLD